ncbi:ATP-binding protein [Leifsonia sp. AG29]|uniref:ATP-binding protein n=1 Tax=Leifsonia sp. AG29 TaxID=2598860 RepID=UPI00131CF7E8|nr:ATP-binding protein [Leifsonia sp. AG29]
MTEPFRESFRAPADLASIGRVHEIFERLSERRPDLTGDLRSAFELAVVEVVTNVVQHSEEERPVQVELLIRTTPGGLEAVVTDDAPPVDLAVADAAMPDPEDLGESGRGLALIGLLVDRFEHEPLAAGNRWTLARG